MNETTVRCPSCKHLLSLEYGVAKKYSDYLVCHICGYRIRVSKIDNPEEEQ
jgi:transcription elongation factor Elf1